MTCFVKKKSELKKKKKKKKKNFIGKMSRVILFNLSIQHIIRDNQTDQSN